MVFTTFNTYSNITRVDGWAQRVVGPTLLTVTITWIQVTRHIATSSIDLTTQSDINIFEISSIHFDH